jgi:hypothetical protein
MNPSSCPAAVKTTPPAYSLPDWRAGLRGGGTLTRIEPGSAGRPCLGVTGMRVTGQPRADAGHISIGG